MTALIDRSGESAAAHSAGVMFAAAIVAADDLLRADSSGQTSTSNDLHRLRQAMDAGLAAQIARLAQVKAADSLSVVSPAGVPVAIPPAPGPAPAAEAIAAACRALVALWLGANPGLREALEHGVSIAPTAYGSVEIEIRLGGRAMSIEIGSPDAIGMTAYAGDGPTEIDEEDLTVAAAAALANSFWG